MRIVWCQMCTVPGRVRTLSGTLTLQIVESCDPELQNMEKVWTTWRTWKRSTSWVKTLYLWFKYSIHDSKQSICQPDDSKQSIYSIYFNGWENHNIRPWHLENMIMGQLKLGKDSLMFILTIHIIQCHKDFLQLPDCSQRVSRVK